MKNQTADELHATVDEFLVRIVVRKNIYGVTLDELKEYMCKNGETAAKGVFLYKKLYGRELNPTRENVSGDLWERVQADFDFSLLRQVAISECADTCKYLFELADGNTIETVLMKYSFGTGVCVSTQVGCNMGCVFCESGRLKKVRNLTEAEIVGQVAAVRQITGEWPNNITVMGIGEPLDNLENLLRFIDIISNPFGAGYGTRHITVSTSGLVPAMRRFLRETSANLAVSLHAPNDELRNMLMPVNRKWPLADLMAVLKEEGSRSNEAKITFEYLLVDGINDSDECAMQLAELVKQVNGYVNLIPYNATGASIEIGKRILTLRKSPVERKNRFFDILKQSGCMVTVRREFGADMNAACGQLRATKMK